MLTQPHGLILTHTVSRFNNTHTNTNPFSCTHKHLLLQSYTSIAVNVMSKDDCKVGCKHKERKPKKPHYIPRPWGKPYNYKCFQCPFTCMEKSHLYNHMKYSLCKNSLSLLIESDWPYKKGHPLHPDQLRLQQGNLRSRSPAKSQPETPDDPTRSGPGDGENAEGEIVEREAEKEGEAMETNGSGVPETCQNRRTKQETDAVMADMFSLEEQLLRARSIEVESKLRNYRLSKTCLTGPALLSEQWRFLSNQTSNTKPKSDPVSSSSLSCYPPPSSTGQLECSDTPAFNLSLLGYPLTPGLLSYLNPVTAGTATAQISPLPFLGSNALAHSQRHSDRSLIPPHLYYPFLCEHSFATPASTTTSSETGKMIKPSAVSLPPPSYPTKLNLWKVPALRPVSNQSSPAAWLTRTCSSPEQSHGVKDRLRSRETRSGWQQDASFTKEQSLKRTAASQDPRGASVEKKAAFEFALDSLMNANKSSRLLVNNSARSEASSPPHVSEQLEVRQRGMETETDPAAALLQDFSTLLHEYQNTEQRAASLPEQSHLWAHLGKIRSELSHIQQALERTARFNEGPLDLSVKKDLTGTTNVLGEAGETKDVVDENYLETEEEEDDDDDDDDEEQTVRNRQKCTLDTLMKLHQPQGPVVKTEVMSEGGLAIRSDSADVLWHSTTTKCEADSSVLLCSKTPNRPPSIQHLDTLCPTSPLTTTDTMV